MNVDADLVRGLVLRIRRTDGRLPVENVDAAREIEIGELIKQHLDAQAKEHVAEHLAACEATHKTMRLDIASRVPACLIEATLEQDFDGRDPLEVIAGVALAWAQKLIAVNEALDKKETP